MAVQAAAQPAPTRWSRSYPPLAFLALAVLIAAFVLPSSLNLPQSNPSTVLEYAPVPPEDEQPNPPPGNLSSLGLGSSSTLGVGSNPAPAAPPLPKGERGTGDKPSVKRCLGDPPRQTDDLNAPPCVPFFEGDNFGATYQGVTKDEITVLLYWDDGIYNNEPAHEGVYHDLDGAPKRPCSPRDPRPAECDSPLVRANRALGVFFNDRFQTYNRHVRFVGYYTGASTDAARRADAAKFWTELKPFAVLDQATFSGHNQAFVDTMAARGVLNFSSLQPLPNSQYRKSAPLVWGFWPDVEHWAEQYVTYVCTRVKPFTVRHHGNPPGQGAPNGLPRKFGLYYTEDQGATGLRYFAILVKDGIKKCGITDPVEHTFPNSGFIADGSDTGTDQADGVAKFRTNNVTTILWLGGVEGKFTQAADKVAYYPEIVIAGDLELDNNANGRLQNQNVWQNAWGTQLVIRIDRLEDSPGYKAYKEANPNGPPTPDGLYARDAYRDHFNLFQGIQAAGPELTPDTVDQGLHAFPQVRSTSPYVAAYFYDPGDYTGVKDAMEVWWDPAGTGSGATVESTNTRPGCMRMTRGGLRYLAGTWPPADEAFDRSRNDAPCTAYGGSFQYRVS